MREREGDCEGCMVRKEDVVVWSRAEQNGGEGWPERESEGCVQDESDG
jgi:hypothetical protein